MVTMSMHVENLPRDCFCDSVLIIALLANGHGKFIWDVMTASFLKNPVLIIGKMPWTPREVHRYLSIAPQKKLTCLRADS